MKTALAAIGFTATSAQVMLMRELVATFYGNELLFGLILAAWLAWGAVGATVTARRRPLPQPLPYQGRGEGGGVVAAGLILAALALPAELALIRGARALLGVTPGALVEFGPMVATVALILAPLCLLSGALFTLGARLIVERGGTAGQAYAWESAGAVAGGTLFSFVFVRWLDPFQTALLVTSVNLIIAGTLWLSHRSPPPLRHRSLAPLLLCALLLPASLLVGRALHHATLRWQWPDPSTGSGYHLVFAADSPYGRLTVQARDGQRSFYTDGRLVFETQGTFPEEVAHFPLLAHPAPRDVLLIGGGVAGDLREILKHPIEGVTYVELDPLLIRAAQAHLPPEDAAVLDDPRVTVVLDDGRRYVKAVANAGRGAVAVGQIANLTYFDVIILDLPEPATGALNRFYTAEFFAEARAILRPGGILALHLPSAENYWSKELTRRNASVYHTLKTAFPELLVLPGEHTFFLASDRPVEADPAVLAGRLAGRGVRTRWVTPDYIEYVFTTDRFAAVRQALESAKGVRLNRDLAPICYYYDLVLWLSLFYPNLRGAYESASLVNPSTDFPLSPVGDFAPQSTRDFAGQALWWAAVPLALVALLARWRRAWAVPLVVAGAGLAQMMLEVMLLFAFQVLHGYVYAEVSLIVTAFMAGLALGSAGSNWLLGTRNVKRKTQNVKWALLAVLATLAIYSGALPFLFSRPIPAPTVTFPLLALLAGCLGGMVFPLATAWQMADGKWQMANRRSQVAGRKLQVAGRKLQVVDSEENTHHAPRTTHHAPRNMQSTAAGILYAADLAGGCVGALLGAVFLVPVLGIPQTCAAIALVALAGLITLA